MLFYREDKLLRSDFAQVWSRVEEFLQLATPASRQPRAVTIWDERDPTKRAETMAFATQDRAMQPQVDELYARARLVHQHVGFRVYLRWQPEFGPTAIDFPAFSVNHQVTLLQQVRPHFWLFFQLLTSFQRHDDPAFRQFLDQAESILRVRLLPKNWRYISIAKSGNPIFRKVSWLGGA